MASNSYTPGNTPAEASRFSINRAKDPNQSESSDEDEPENHRHRNNVFQE